MRSVDKTRAAGETEDMDAACYETFTIVATGNRRDSKNYRTEHVERMESGALSVAGIPGHCVRRAGRHDDKSGSAGLSGRTR